MELKRDIIIGKSLLKYDDDNFDDIIDFKRSILYMLILSNHLNK